MRKYAHQRLIFNLYKTAEEIAEIKEKVLSLKSDANSDYNNYDYLGALNKYTSIINLATEIDFKEQLAILYCNKGLCFSKMVKYN